MTRPMLSVISAILLGACSFSALSADYKSAAETNSGQDARAQVDEKRDKLSGADQVEKPVEQDSSKFFEAPVETSDAPVQEQKP